MLMNSKVILICALMLGGASASRAEIIYDNFGAGDTVNPTIAFAVFSLNTIDYDTALPFTIPGSSSYSLSSIELPIRSQCCVAPATDQLTISVRTDAGGAPSNTTLESFTLALPDDTPRAVYSFNSTSHPTLAPGATYWVMADATSPGGLFDWGIRPGDGPPLTTIFRTNNGPWVLHTEGEAAMRVTAVPVPEPSTMALLVAALPLGYLACRRRRTEPSTC
jgi:hypothetical protein